MGGRRSLCWRFADAAPIVGRVDKPSCLNKPAGTGEAIQRPIFPHAQGRAAMMPIADNSPALDTTADQAHHGPRVIGKRPFRPAPQSDGGSSLDPRRIISGLKYHWFLFIVFGSLLGAGLGAAAWTLL